MFDSLGRDSVLGPDPEKALLLLLGFAVGGFVVWQWVNDPTNQQTLLEWQILTDQEVVVGVLGNGLGFDVVRCVALAGVGAVALVAAMAWQRRRARRQEEEELING